MGIADSEDLPGTTIGFTTAQEILAQARKRSTIESGGSLVLDSGVGLSSYALEMVAQKLGGGL